MNRVATWAACALIVAGLAIMPLSLIVGAWHRTHEARATPTAAVAGTPAPAGLSAQPGTPSDTPPGTPPGTPLAATSRAARTPG